MWDRLLIVMVWTILVVLYVGAILLLILGALLYGILFVLITVGVVACIFCGYFVLKCGLIFQATFCKNHYRYMPFLSASGLEDIGRVLLVLCGRRDSAHHSYSLARLRLAIVKKSKQAYVRKIALNWQYLPLWIKQEIGFVALNDTSVLDLLRLEKVSDIFDLYSGALISGTLRQFKPAMISLQTELLKNACWKQLQEGGSSCQHFRMLERFRYNQLSVIQKLLEPFQLRNNGKVWLQGFIREEKKRLKIKH